MSRRIGRGLRALLGAVAALVTLLGAAGTAAADPGPDPNRPGPPLSVPAADLARALTCSAGVDGAANPVLLIHGTFLTPQENFSWNYERAFRAAHRPYCTVTLPDHAVGEVPRAAEYVVAAIRTMSARSGHPISLVGYSQGGMIGRWGLRFWPDTRPLVAKVIGLDASNHGTLDAYPACLPLGCAPALWQQQSFSRFTTALNSRAETFAGIAYTSIYTPTDEVATSNLPPWETSGLFTGDGARANISTADVCPAHVAEHLSMGTIDPVGYALVVDALDHPGTGSAARIDRRVCTQPFLPGVDPAAVGPREAQILARVGAVLVTHPHVPAEPPLPAYAR